MAKDLAEARKLLIDSLRNDHKVHAYPGASKYTVYATSVGTEFVLSFMPGNRRTLISHGVKVEPQWRGRGINTHMCRVREQAARVAGVTLMLATVKDDNAAEIHVLENNGWKRLTQNYTTKCSLWGKQLGLED